MSLAGLRYAFVHLYSIQGLARRRNSTARRARRAPVAGRRSARSRGDWNSRSLPIIQHAPLCNLPAGMASIDVALNLIIIHACQRYNCSTQRTCSPGGNDVRAPEWSSLHGRHSRHRHGRRPAACVFVNFHSRWRYSNFTLLVNNKPQSGVWTSNLRCIQIKPKGNDGIRGRRSVGTERRAHARQIHVRCVSGPRAPVTASRATRISHTLSPVCVVCGDATRTTCISI
jgi:hypothetical protein